MSKARDFNHIKEWLLPQLEARQYSITEFAREAGLSRAAIYAYLVDRNRPDHKTAKRICQTLSRLRVLDNRRGWIFVRVDADELLNHYTPKRQGRPRKYHAS